MIELNKKTQQDFLNREWVKKLLDAGVDMSDAKYYIITGIVSGIDYVLAKEDISNYHYRGLPSPTYTVSELLYKLHEWIYPKIDGKEYAGGLRFCKDAPFYIFYYHLENEDKTKWNEDFRAEFEYPIESLAGLLIQCHTKDIGMKYPNTGNISDK